MFTEDDVPCNDFLQVDKKENFDVCYHCNYHRLDHPEKEEEN